MSPLVQFVQNNLLLFAVAIISGAMLLWPLFRRTAGAKNVPLARIDERAAELGKRKDRPLILYCDTANRSGKALSALKKQGFTRVVNLSGGLGAWQQAGLPVEK